MCLRKNPSPKLLRAEIAFRSCVPDTSRSYAIIQRLRRLGDDSCDIPECNLWQAKHKICVEMVVVCGPCVPGRPPKLSWIPHRLRFSLAYELTMRVDSKNSRIHKLVLLPYKADVIATKLWN